MNQHIALLSAEVAAQIAAGEVVERPANVAKELIENSLDAGAREVRVEIREGGQRLLRVSDDGAGVLPGEMELAFARHATSKLQRADELSCIATFGFRGEALYTIAAVSHVTMTSRHRESAFGSQIRLEGGVVVHQGRAGTPVGTVVSVEQLFCNTPARKAFLRRPATEAGYITHIVQRYALAYPECRFSMVNDGRLVFQSTGSGDLLAVLVKLYGLEQARQMVSIAPTAAAVDGTAEAPLEEEPFMAADAAPAAGAGSAPLQVSGYVSLPSLHRANRSQIDLFVNRRYIEDRSLTYAVVQAYHTLLPVGRAPIAVVLVTLPPEEVDVNVHPQKSQVRFRDERRVFAAVQRTVRQALVAAAPVPGLFLNPEEPRDPAGAGDAEVRSSGGWAERRQALLLAGRAVGLETGVSLQRQEERLAPTAAPPEGRDEVGPGPAGAATDEGLPPLRVVGQVGAMYVVAEGPAGLYLIDQHAAHERVLYERYMEQRRTTAGQRAQQQLLEPIPLHTGQRLTGLVAHYLSALDEVGFAIEPFGGETYLLRAVPALLEDADPLAMLTEIIDGLAEERNLVGEALEARLVNMICKRAAIKAGQSLSQIEMEELVRQLERCRSPRTCPHGRPTMLQLSAGELEKAFGRI